MTGAPIGRKGMTDQCKGTKRLRVHHRGQNLGSVNGSGWSPFSHGVGCLYKTCQRFFSTRQQVVEKPNLPQSTSCPSCGKGCPDLHGVSLFSCLSLPAWCPLLCDQGSLLNPIVPAFLPLPILQLSCYTAWYGQWWSKLTCKALCEHATGGVRWSLYVISRPCLILSK